MSDPVFAASDAPHETRGLAKVSVILLAGAMAALLDTTMISVALADVGRAFGATPAQVQFVSTAYLLAMATVVPVMGWCVDRWGARTTWMLALGLFAAGAWMCSAAGSVTTLIASRVVQGAGGGLILPLVQAILAQAAGPQRFGRAMSLVAIPGQLAPILGPALGAAVLTALGWRWIFLIHLPLTLVSLALARKGLPETGRTAGARSGVSTRTGAGRPRFHPDAGPARDDIRTRLATQVRKRASRKSAG